MTCSRSKLSAQMPMMKPNRLNDTPVSARKVSIQIGWSIRTGTKHQEVARMIRPSRIDLVAAAPT